VDTISQKALRFFLNTTSPFSKRLTHPQFFRDQFTISTWLALGALCQATLFLLFGRLAFLPALLLILYRTADTFLVAVGVKRNHELDGVILKKFSAQYPDTAGNFGNTPANQEIVVFLIGGRINQFVHSNLHP